MARFNEKELELAFIKLIQQENYTHQSATDITREYRDVLIEDDLKSFLISNYRELTENEVTAIILHLKTFSSNELYKSNKAIHQILSDGMTFKREDRSQKDLLVELIDYSEDNKNIYKFVTQLPIEGTEKRIPDGVLYINGLPLVVFEFKSATQENTTIHDAYTQLTVRYRRDIPELFKYNVFCVISDGVNTKAGSLFAPYEFFYAWRRIDATTQETDDIGSMITMVKGLFNQDRLREVIRHFIYFPDSSKKEEKIVCRYPQYYAATKLYENIRKTQKPEGSGKGGTYFGATGSGKSFTMLFLTRLLMKSIHFASPTIVLITDRTDLDDQLAEEFTNAKQYIGDDQVVSAESREHLKRLLQGRQGGGVLLTTIHKFTEDLDVLTERANVICISDEAHRSQTNLQQKVSVTDKGVKKSYGFAKYLHDSLPNATYVGFTGTPIDATLDVFGDIVDSYTMTESVKDEITVPLVYEGRAAKVNLNQAKLEEIEAYYAQVADEGANEYQIEASKKATANMNAIIGDPDRLATVAQDFVQHYEGRIKEGASIKGKAMFVCSSRKIAYNFFKDVTKLRPEWNNVLEAEEGAVLTEKEKKKIKPMERIKMIMTRGNDDPKEMYDLLGTKEDRKELDRQFKNEKSNFKIAVVVDMWLTGFDVPFLDTIYIDKPIKQHNLIQAISRVNRKFESKDKGLVVDYIGFKKQMNLALAKYSVADTKNIEDIRESLKITKNHLDLLSRIFHRFDSSKYFEGKPLEQLNTLNNAAEYIQASKEQETRFMGLVKRLKAAYNICVGIENLVKL